MLEEYQYLTPISGTYAQTIQNEDQTHNNAQWVKTSVWKQLDFIIEFATYRMKQPSMKQLTARPLISQKTVFKRAVMSCF